MPGGDQSYGTVWPGHSFEQESETITSPIGWILELVAPSLHAVIKDLLLIASASKGRIAFALI